MGYGLRMDLPAAKLLLQEIFAMKPTDHSDVVEMLREMESFHAIEPANNMADCGVRNISKMIKALRDALELLQANGCDIKGLGSVEKSGLSNCDIILTGLLKFQSSMEDTSLDGAQEGTEVDKENVEMHTEGLDTMRGFSLPAFTAEPELIERMKTVRAGSFSDFEYLNEMVENLER